VTSDRETPIGPHPLHILYGHDDAVTSVAVSAELDTVVSGSDDGTIIVHSLREGVYIRSIVDGSGGGHGPPTARVSSGSGAVVAGSGGAGAPQASARVIPAPAPALPVTPTKAPQGGNKADSSSSSAAASAAAVVGGGGGGESSSNHPPLMAAMQQRRVTWVGVSKEAYIVSYSPDDLTLCTHTINGELKATKVLNEKLHVFAISEDGHVLITGGDGCLIVFRWIRTLELACDGPRAGLEAVLDGSMEDSGIPPFASPVRSLYLTKWERHLIVGLESGELRILAQDSDYLRQRLQRKLIEIGIL
jgi:WD40 repeat protein